MSTRPRTLSELLLEVAAAARPRGIRLLWCTDPFPRGEREPVDGSVRATYADVCEMAGRAAAHLADHGIRAGSRVLLVLPNGARFLTAFFGCQLIGAVPVPLVPPWTMSRAEAHVMRLAAVARQCRATATVMPDDVQQFLKSAPNAGAATRTFGRVLAAEHLLSGASSRITPSFIEDTAAAFIQFTSGSTAIPRGALISHRAVLTNCAAIAKTIGCTSETPGCSWLPMFHDMGLIGHVLTPLSTNTESILMPPEAFVREPCAWLHAISRYRAVISAAPNSGYDLAARRVRDEDIDQIDLSSWRVALCGGEPIFAQTLARFAGRFARCGFASTAFLPVYGLAEATLAVTAAEPGAAPRVDSLDRQTFVTERRAVPTAGTAVVSVVCVGRPLAGIEVRIVRADGRLCDDRELGAVEVRGPSLMNAYMDDPVATGAALRDGWLRTGDDGYLVEGALFVTGRTKEVIVKGGRNLYPYDIEAAATLPAIRPGRVVAFGMPQSRTGTEEVVIVAETSVRNHKVLLRLEYDVAAAVFAATGTRPDLVVLCRPGTLGKTSSGKLRRSEARDQYMNGTLAGDRRFLHPPGAPACGSTLKRT